MTDISRFFKHSSIYAIGNLFNRIGAFILLPVYTNYLTVGEYGTIELFYIAISIFSGFLGVGLAHATLRFYFDHDNQSDQNASVTTNYLGSLAITITGVLLISIFSGDITERFLGSEELKIGVYIILATLVLELSSQICLAYIRAIEYSMFFVIISIVKLIIQVGVNSYLVIVEGAGVVGVLTGNLIAVFIGWLFLSIFTIWRCGLVFHMSKFIPTIKYSYPFLLSAIMGLIANNADKIILNHLISIEALGVFALALRFSMILEQLIGEPFTKSYGAFRYTIMKRDDAGNIQADIVRYLLIFATFSALGISLFVKDLLLVMSDESFWGAANLVPILMFASILKLLRYPAATGILYAKKTKYMFYFTTVAAVFSPISSYLLISYIGLFGACISLVLTEAIVFLLMNHYSQRYFTVNYEIGKMVSIVGFAAALFLSSLLLTEFPMVISMLIKSGILLLFITAMFISPAISKEENVKLKVFLNTKILRKAN